MVQRFIRGLTLPLWLASEHLIASEYTFLQVVDHARSIEWACLETYAGGGKRPHNQYNFNNILFRGRQHLNRGHSKLIRPIEVGPYVIDGTQICQGVCSGQSFGQELQGSHLGFQAEIDKIDHHILHTGLYPPQVAFIVVSLGTILEIFQTGPSRVTPWVRATGVCCDCDKVGHWSRECPRYGTIAQSAQPCQFLVVVAPLVRSVSQCIAGGSMVAQFGIKST